LGATIGTAGGLALAILLQQLKNGKWNYER
jgi:hypothetical protein